MKTLLTIVILAVTLCSGTAQAEPEHEWRVTLKVIDDLRQPVSGAEVWVNYLTNRLVGPTDSNGVYIASHTDHSVQLAFQARKTGYYTFGMQYFLGFRYDPVKWSPSVEVVLGRIVNPTPMYAKSVNSGMPAFDKAVGFDLMLGDWMAPYGKGMSGDVLFTAHRERRAEDDSDYELVVSFAHQGDGIQEFPSLPTGNDGGLRSPYEAPSDGYQPQWVQTKVRRPGQPMKSNSDMGRNYFVRVRTVLDENGNIKSALYGKIYGDFMQFTYYLNPTPNDRNIEFDPKHNLMRLGQREIRIQAP